MRAGAARASITPPWPVELAGFASRGNAVVTPTEDDLHVRLLVLESAGATSERVCIASADLCNWPKELVAAHREALSLATGAKPANIMLCATHNHSGPQPNRSVAPSVGRLDERYLSFFTARLKQAATHAAQELHEVLVSRWQAEHPLGQQRRIIVDGRVDHGVDPAGPNDPRLTGVAFTDTTGRPIALLLHYTCHAVVSAENIVGGDYPGAAALEMERETGAITLFLQGCCGDVNPAELTATTSDNARRAGQALARVALSGLDTAIPVGPEHVVVANRHVELPYRQVPTQSELEALSRQPGHAGTWATHLLRRRSALPRTARLHIQLISLFAGLELLAMNGEMSVEYGLRVRDLGAGQILPIGYANGMVGYVPRAHQIRAGRYEAVDSALYYLLPSGFAETVEPRIDAAIDGLLPAVEGP